MSSPTRMSALELRASIGLAGIFGLRMLGMFVILPVFALYAGQLQGGDNLTLVGVALGAYGLTQAILQIPFGWMSDRYGRKPVIYFGLAVFAAGSFVAAWADNIVLVILGRTLQGAGAISAAVIAMVADLTRETHRTKAMALIGSTIGLTFALSLAVSPWLNNLIGVPGIFALTGVLSLLAIGVVYGYIPDPPVPDPVHVALPAPGFLSVLREPQLARLNFGILSLHAVLMALFIVVPLSLRDIGLATSEHGHIYLPVMLVSFVLMVPAIMFGERRGHGKGIFVGAVALLLAGQIAMPWMLGSALQITAFLLIFFTAFNVLEAMLPSLTSKLAPPAAKGTAIGVYSSVQFLGAFIGAASGGFLFQHFGARGVFAFNTTLLAIWLLLAFGMRAQPPVTTRSYALPALDGERAAALLAMLAAQPGVREVRFATGEHKAYLKVDAKGFDEQLVLRLIAGAT